MQISKFRSNQILIEAELGEHYPKLCAFPGYTRWKDRLLVVRVTGANIQYILSTWPQAEWIGGSLEIKEDHLRRIGLAEEVVKNKNSNAILDTDDDFIYKRPPMDHQRKAFLLSRDREAFGLFMEQGTGKTKVTIDNACYLYGKKEIDCLLVVAWPNGVHRNWIEYELPEDMSLEYKACAWAPDHRTKRKQKELAETLAYPGLKVFAFNVEAFTSEHAQEWIRKILETTRSLFVIDQSASIKNPNAERTKFLLKVAPLAPYRRILDGAPVAEGAGELFSQFKFLDQFIIGHDTWTGFKAEFCNIGYFNQIVGYKNLDELHRRIDGHCFRARADECLDLPERIYKKWPFDLSSRERRIFDELRVADITTFKVTGELEEGEDHDTIEESLAMVKNMRLQQVSSGWFATDDDPKLIEKKPSRLIALLSLLEHIEGKALIFGRFRSDLDLIQDYLGDKAVSYHGGISNEGRDEAKRRFMNDPDILYFIGQPQNAGIGHTLTAASHVIFYSNHPSLRLREESEKRAHRKGLKHTLTVWDLLGTDTQDRKIIGAFRSKKDLSNTILKDPEGFFLKW